MVSSLPSLQIILFSLEMEEHVGKSDNIFPGNFEETIVSQPSSSLMSPTSIIQLKAQGKNGCSPLLTENELLVPCSSSLGILIDTKSTK